MVRLFLSLLGTPQFSLEGKPVTFKYNKAKALLAYLAVESGGPHLREGLAALFWPNLPDAAARRNLTQALSSLRQTLADDRTIGPFLSVTRETVRFNSDSDHELDLTTFSALLAACHAHAHRRIESCSACAERLRQAARLYRGDFLAYLSIGDSGSFDEWVESKRAALREDALWAFANLAAYHERQGDSEPAAALARRQLEIDPWREAAHRQLMRLLAAAGQRNAALAHYDSVRRELAKELDTTPEPETTALYDHLRLELPDKPHALRHNLPNQLTSFIGREKEIAELTRLLTPTPSPSLSSKSSGERWHASAGEGVRLVTLTGVGGTGKTRLALQVTAGQLDHFPDGVWLIELAPLADPALVPQSVASVLGLRETPGRPIMAVLLDDLGPKRALLVLDNCEHLIQACAELADLLLRACPHLTVLATSREGLAIAGESAYHVRSLSLPDPNQRDSLETMAQSESVRLFVERSAAALPGFALTHDNATAVAQVCRRLDGIPLAIELAAARVKVLRVEEIAARLNDRFQLLTGGSRTSLPRHQTLAALIDWSYALLPAPERTLFSRLAVFAGGWTLEAAEAVGAGEGVEAHAVLDLLMQLANKSLVVIERKLGAEAWYRLLETIRQYALAKLAASGEADATRRRHAAYYLTLWESNRGGINDRPARAWFDRGEMELDNLRAALTWSQSPLGDPELGLRLSGALSSLPIGITEARGWLEAALARADAERANYPQARAAALQELGTVDGALADYASARAHLAQSLMLFQELGDKTSSAGGLERLGWLAREQGDAVTARLRLAESLALFRELGDKNGVAGTLNTLGEVAVMQGEAAEAAGLLKEALALNREFERTEGIGWSLNHLGHVAQLQGEYELARRLHKESLLMFRELQQQNWGVDEANQALGETALAQGDSRLATRHFWEALDLTRYHGARAYLPWSLAGLAGAAVLDEEPERAARLWGAAEALRLSIGAREAPASRATRERLMAAAREQLGEAAFAAAWAEGQAMTMEQAIDLALDKQINGTAHRFGMA